MKIQIHLTGTNALLMHSDRLADPFNDLTKKMKELTGIRKKTDDIQLRIRELEFEGSLYINEKGPYLPSWNIRRSFIDGARLSKQGKAVERALDMIETEPQLIYQGPRDIAGLYNTPQFVDTRSVSVGTSRVMRTRPRFPEWAVTVNARIREDLLNLAELRLVAQVAGESIGIGDFRQQFGRYDAEILEVK